MKLLRATLIFFVGCQLLVGCKVGTEPENQVKADQSVSESSACNMGRLDDLYGKWIENSGSVPTSDYDSPPLEVVVDMGDEFTKYPDEEKAFSKSNRDQRAKLNIYASKFKNCHSVEASSRSFCQQGQKEIELCKRAIAQK
jgi:hypothetical protein